MYLSATFIYQVTTNRAILFVIITYQCLFCAGDLTTLSLLQIYIKWHSGDEEMLAQHRRMLFWRTSECSQLIIKKKLGHNSVPSQIATGNSLNILDWLSENVSYALLMWMRPINVLFVIWIMTALCSIKCCNLPKRHLREKKVVILTHALNFLFAFVYKTQPKGD